MEKETIDRTSNNREAAAPDASGNGPEEARLNEEPFTILFAFYSPDDNDISMPLACLSAQVKREIPGIRVHMAPILPLRDEKAYTAPGFVDLAVGIKPDLVAISCTVPNWEPLDPYLGGLNEAMPRTPVIVGGYQAILRPDMTIEHPAVDFICVGDGEAPLTELVRRLKREKRGEGGGSAINGLWEKTDNREIIRTEPVLTKNLSDAPFPDYTIFEKDGALRSLNMSNFSRPDLFILPVMSGRGCPYKCTYCSNETLRILHRGRGKYLRKYDPEPLVEELCRLRDRYGVDFFEFWDELFMFDMKFVWKFLELYGRRVRTPFSIMSRVERMDERFCKTAAEAGCAFIWFGIECGNERYRSRRLNRKMTNRQILDASENARKYGIQRMTLNMVGMPFETREEMLETLTFNQTLEPEFFVFFVYMPLWGTPLHDAARDAGLLLPKMADDYLEGYRNRNFRMNIRESPGGVSNEEFNEICNRMLDFANRNNRLELEGGEPR